jgi:hypothetical protein
LHPDKRDKGAPASLRLGALDLISRSVRPSVGIDQIAVVRSVALRF